MTEKIILKMTMMYDEYFTFVHPFTSMIAGPTGSGKTQFVVELLKKKEQVISPAPQRIIYCYSIWQDTFDKLKQTIKNI